LQPFCRFGIGDCGQCLAPGAGSSDWSGGKAGNQWQRGHHGTTGQISGHLAKSPDSGFAALVLLTGWLQTHDSEGLNAGLFACRICTA
jgi:hypothetical protein